MTDSITIYTDGGCEHNPGGRGGYGVVIIDGESVREYKQGYISTTNNRMEVMAIIRGLKEVRDLTRPIDIYSDSQYAIYCAIGSWERKKNIDLWKEYDNICANKDITFHWVKGHTGNRYNERCDSLASEAMNGSELIGDKGYTRGARK